MIAPLGFGGRIVLPGLGCIGQALLPLLPRHLVLAPGHTAAIDPDPAGQAQALAQGARFVRERLGAHNLDAVLGARLGPGDFLVNLSVDSAVPRR
jgi:homospermidine synthase